MYSDLDVQEQASYIKKYIILKWTSFLEYLLLVTKCTFVTVQLYNIRAIKSTIFKHIVLSYDPFV